MYGNFMKEASHQHLGLRCIQYEVGLVLESLSPETKGMQHEANHLSPTSTEVRNVWSYISTSWYVFMAQCSMQNQNNFTRKNPSVHLGE
jgi:hypothetical protein